MDLLTTLWLASVLGAASFFVCGLASHAALARRRAAQQQEIVAPPDPRLAILEGSLARASLDAQAASARVAALEQELVQRRAQATMRDRELDEARKQLADARIRHDRELAEARRLATDAQTVRDRELAEARRLATDAQTARDRELAMAHQRLAQASARGDALAEQLAAARKPAAKPTRSRPRPVIGPDTLEANLSAQLGSLADECGYEVVVLSDAQGLLLAGVGEEQAQGTIAALSSVARELSTRAAEFVGLQPVVLEVGADDGRKLRIRLFEWERESIALASFGKSRIAPAEEEESVITVFPTLMAAS